MLSVRRIGPDGRPASILGVGTGTGATPDRAGRRGPDASRSSRRCAAGGIGRTRRHRAAASSGRLRQRRPGASRPASIAAESVTGGGRDRSSPVGGDRARSERVAVGRCARSMVSWRSIQADRRGGRSGATAIGGLAGQPAPGRRGPSSVSTMATQSTGVRPKCIDTSVSVGITTIRLGVTRYGPSAPVTSQLGKYDVLTSTGTPGSETLNEIESSPISMSETSTSGSSVRGSSGTWSMVPVSPELVAGVLDDVAQVVGHGAGLDPLPVIGPVGGDADVEVVALAEPRAAPWAASRPGSRRCPSTTTGSYGSAVTGSASATS